MGVARFHLSFFPVEMHLLGDIGEWLRESEGSSSQG